MGQVGSIQKNHKPPISISNGLELRRIQIKGINDDGDGDDFKTINIDNEKNALIILPKNPLSEFIQNETNPTFDEFPFLLKISNNSLINLRFGLSNELIDDFHQMKVNLNQFTIFNNLKILITNGDGGSKIIKDEIITRVVQITTGPSSKKENNKETISINSEGNQFDVDVDLNELKGIKGKVYITLLGNNEEIFKTLIFINETSSLDNGRRPVERTGTDETAIGSTSDNDIIKNQQIEPITKIEDPQFQFINDGPIFRNNLLEIETNLNNFKSLIKNIIKKCQALEESERNSAITRSNLCSSLSDLNNYSSNIDHKILKEIINDMISILTEKSTQNIEDANLIMKNLTTPFLLLYNSDLKSLQTKKKIYQNQSKDFYTWMQSNDSQAEQSTGEDHHFQKRLEFEIHRLEYFNYLNEYRNGYLIRNLIHNMAIFLQNTNPETSTKTYQISQDISKAFVYYENFSNYKSEQSAFKNKLESVNNYQDLSQLISSPPDTTNNGSSVSSERPKPIKKDSSKLFKEGILHTFGGHDPKRWFKQYVTLKDNTLTEYKDSKTSKSNPIDLTFACIKKIDTIPHRKFCFEIITPLNVKRIFQTESDLDRESWLKCLNIAIALKAAHNNQFTPIASPSVSREPRSSLGRSMSTLGRSKDDLALSKSIKRSSSVRKSSYNPSSENLATYQQLSATPLSIVRDVDQSNRICCDCGSNKGVEWISINLLTVVCIDCSGIHRSLGTHISKIRSLTLDNKSFQTKESLELLYHVSNKIANSYWEGNMSVKDKITPLSTPEERKAFIIDKYQNKKFMIQEPNFKPNDSLIKGIHTSNIPLILKSLAMGANTKMTVVKSLGSLKLDLTLFEYSLTRFHGSQEDPIFDVSTILLLNNTPCGEKVSNNLPLGPRQVEFWKSKIDQYHHKPFNSKSMEPLQLNGNGITGIGGNDKVPRSISIRKSLSLKNITDKTSSKAKDPKDVKPPKDRTNRTSRLRFPKLK